MDTVEQLERSADIAQSKLGVAEELGWIVALFAATAAYLRWENWPIAFIAFGAGYFFATYRYRKNAARAKDVYHRAAGLGKYVKPESV